MSEPRVKKLGIVVDHFAGLAGATDFIISFADSAARAAKGREVVLIVRHDPSLISPRGFARGMRSLLRGSIPSSAPSPDQVIEHLRNAGMPDLPVRTSVRTDIGLVRLCNREAIDVVGPISPPNSPRFPIPFVGYIYDFQHRYLPEFFKPEEAAARDAQFKSILTRSNSVVVNASAVKADAERFFPGAAERVVSLPFSASPKSEWFCADTAKTRHRYEIGERYFMVSNQFWIHKRHEVAIRAFARIARDDNNIQLVLTGATWDYRSSNRLDDIQALIRELGVSSRVHILGLVPKLDQIAIMRGAIALIQPTAFEGGPGGGSVFDATALGVPTVVSDIPVNREIADHVTAYFPLDDVEALVARLDELLHHVWNRQHANELMRDGAHRRLKMGQAIWHAADVALQHFRAQSRSE